MNQNELQSLIASSIQQSISGQEIEHAKLEFKKEWYNLKEDKGIAAFLKDASAIANTVGPDGYLIIGFDTKTNQYNPVKFSDSGLRDSSELSGMIVKHVDRGFMIDYFPIEVEGNILNVVHIPPSLDKPHVIRNHRSWPGGNLKEEPHRIFVRRGSRIWEATKYELDLMYYDRKNIEPEYQLYGTLHQKSFGFRINVTRSPNHQYVDNIQFHLPITLENTGRRSVSISKVEAIISNTFDANYPEKITFKGEDKWHGKVVLKAQELHTSTYDVENQDFQGRERTLIHPFISMLENNWGKIQLKIILHTMNRVIIPVIINDYKS